MYFIFMQINVYMLEMKTMETGQVLLLNHILQLTHTGKCITDMLSLVGYIRTAAKQCKTFMDVKVSYKNVEHE